MTKGKIRAANIAAISAAPAAAFVYEWLAAAFGEGDARTRRQAARTERMYRLLNISSIRLTVGAR